VRCDLSLLLFLNVILKAKTSGNTSMLRSMALSTYGIAYFIGDFFVDVCPNQNQGAEYRYRFLFFDLHLGQGWSGT